MTEYKVTVSEAGGEYYGEVFIKCNSLDQVSSNVILVNGAEIFFQGEHIAEIMKIELPEVVDSTSKSFSLGNQVEIIADCPFKGLKGELTYVSEESTQVEVTINISNTDERECSSYFRGDVTDIKSI